VVVEVVNLTVGTYIDGVFVDMHATDAIKGVVGIEEEEEMFASKVERVEANIIEVEVLENDIETFGELDQFTTIRDSSLI
jgi:hypothetical protein